MLHDLLDCLPVTLAQVLGEPQHELYMSGPVLNVRLRLDFEPGRQVEIHYEEDNPLELLGWFFCPGILGKCANSPGKPPGVHQGANCLSSQGIRDLLSLNCGPPLVGQD